MSGLKPTTTGVCLPALIYLLFSTSPVPAVEIIRETIPLDNFFGAGARAMGMGGAYMAMGDDLSSLHWNPAGLGLIRRVELAGALSFESGRNRTNFFDESNTAPDRRTRVNSAGVVLPAPVYRGSLVFAIGVNRVQSFDGRYVYSGLNTEPAADEAVRYEEEREARRGGLYQWSAGVSVEVEKGVFVGGGFNFWTGQYDYQWSFLARDAENLSPVNYSLDRWNGAAEFRGYNLTLGVVNAQSRWYRLAFTLSTPTTFRVEGLDEYASEIHNDDGGVDSDAANYGFADEKLPLEVGAGLALTPPYAILEADVRYTGWDEFAPAEDFVGGQDSGYRSVTRVHVGAELFIPGQPMRVRGGYYLDPIALRRVDVKRERRFISLGVGFIFGSSMTLDVAAVRGDWELTQPHYSDWSRTTRIFSSLTYRF